MPLLVTKSSLEGTGQLPKFEEDLFKTNHLVANEESFLIPTGEVPVTNLLRGQLLDKSQVRFHGEHRTKVVNDTSFEPSVVQWRGLLSVVYDVGTLLRPKATRLLYTLS